MTETHDTTAGRQDAHSRAASIEDGQRLWDRRPCSLRHSPRPVGTRECFDEVEARKYFVEPHIPRFAEFPRGKGKRVLEIGCGIGTDTINFARHGAQLTAVDLSGESLKLARARAEEHRLTDRICFYQANAEELSSSIPVEPYDLVYSFGVLHHTREPTRALSKLRRYLWARRGRCGARCGPRRSSVARGRIEEREYSNAR